MLSRRSLFSLFAGAAALVTGAKVVQPVVAAAAPIEPFLTSEAAAAMWLQWQMDLEVRRLLYGVEGIQNYGLLDHPNCRCVLLPLTDVVGESAHGDWL